MDFVEVARFASRLEAETVGHALDPWGIPFFVQCPDIGMFGPGVFAAPPDGAALLVPEDRAHEVVELLTCLGKSPIPEEADPPEE